MDAELDRTTRRVGVRAHDGPRDHERDDTVVVEEPLEIRVVTGAEGRARSVTVTMRTPGADFDLAVGLLFAEGLIRSRADVVDVDFCGPPVPGLDHSNIVRVELDPALEVDLVPLQRSFSSTSSCGLCGKTSLAALDFDGFMPFEGAKPMLAVEAVTSMPERLRAAQPTFARTGGLHGASLCDADGTVLVAREDLGRHNAVDKVVGAELRAGRTDFSSLSLVVSGRVSFEIMQKALAASVPVVVAVGAPSSLAVEMAERFGMTLVGFAREGRFNVYAGSGRIHGALEPSWDRWPREERHAEEGC